MRVDSNTGPRSELWDDLPFMGQGAAEELTTEVEKGWPVKEEGCFSKCS